MGLRATLNFRKVNNIKEVTVPFLNYKPVKL